MRRVVILSEAAEDIEAARDFYDAQQTGIGDYCADCLVADIESLALSRNSFSAVWLLSDAGESVSVRNLPFVNGKRDTSLCRFGFAARSQLDSQRACVACCA
jgi:hypothetical protein